MNYRVHHFEVKTTRDQANVEQFLNNLQGEVVTINSNIALGLSSSDGNFLLDDEKVI